MWEEFCMNKSKIILRIILYPAAAVLIYLFYYGIAMEIILEEIYDLDNYTLYQYITVGILALMEMFGIYMVEFFINKKVNRIFSTVIALLYALIVIGCLCRTSIEEHTWIINPITSIENLYWLHDLSHIGFMITGMLPFGFIMRQMEFKKVFIFSLAAGVVFELIQVFTLRGAFATLDIFIYLIGISLGYFAAKALPNRESLNAEERIT